MFALNRRQPNPVRIDLASVRDTLLYIESDLTGAQDYERLAAAVRNALGEIERLESANGRSEPAPATSARFIPAQL